MSALPLLDQVLDGQPLDPIAVIRQPLFVHEGMRIFKALEQFKKAPVRLATIVNEYRSLEGIVTQTDLLEAIAGDLAEVEGEEPDVVEREDGTLLIDGMMSAQEAFDRLDLQTRPAKGGFHTVAGFMLQQLGHLPKLGEHFDYEGRRFEVVDLDGRRIDKVLAIPKETLENMSLGAGTWPRQCPL
jgi:putative hemolysin